jgi:hypothetical protein
MCVFATDHILGSKTIKLWFTQACKEMNEPVGIRGFLFSQIFSVFWTNFRIVKLLDYYVFKSVSLTHFANLRKTVAKFMTSQNWKEKPLELGKTQINGYSYQNLVDSKVDNQVPGWEKNVKQPKGFLMYCPRFAFPLWPQVCWPVWEWTAKTWLLNISVKSAKDFTPCFYFSTYFLVVRKVTLCVGGCKVKNNWWLLWTSTFMYTPTFWTLVVYGVFVFGL